MRSSSTRAAACRTHGGAGFFHLPFQADEGVIRRLHGVQLRTALVQVGKHILHRGAVLLFQPVQLVSPGLHVIQLPGREVKFLPLVPDTFGKVIYFTAGRFQSFIKIPQILAEGTHTVEGLLGVPQGGYRAAPLVAAA